MLREQPSMLPHTAHKIPATPIVSRRSDTPCVPKRPEEDAPPRLYHAIVACFRSLHEYTMINQGTHRVRLPPFQKVRHVPSHTCCKPANTRPQQPDAVQLAVRGDIDPLSVRAKDSEGLPSKAATLGASTKACEGQRQGSSISFSHQGTIFPPTSTSGSR